MVCLQRSGYLDRTAEKKNFALTIKSVARKLIPFTVLRVGGGGPNSAGIYKHVNRLA